MTIKVEIYKNGELVDTDVYEAGEIPGLTLNRESQWSTITWGSDVESYCQLRATRVA